MDIDSRRLHISTSETSHGTQGRAFSLIFVTARLSLSVVIGDVEAGLVDLAQV